MTVEETGDIMDILSAAYPRFYSGNTAGAQVNALRLWAEIFAEEPVEFVKRAVTEIIAEDVKGFPPVIGVVKSKVDDIKRREAPKDNSWARPYVLKLAGAVTDRESDKLHAVGLMTWREAEADGVNFAEWAREYWDVFPVKEGDDGYAGLSAIA